MDGMILCDKPEGASSHDEVLRVRRALAGAKTGHAGTLDPFATGLLLVLVGRATRIARYVLTLPKTYVTTARYGALSSTGDPDGEIVQTGRGPPGPPRGPGRRRRRRHRRARRRGRPDLRRGTARGRRRQGLRRVPPVRVTLLPDVEPRPRRIAVGTFDGVHLGHREVIRGADTVLTFDPHPSAIVSPNASPPLLTSLERKAERLESLGVGEVVGIP